jgi:hypothetical protein
MIIVIKTQYRLIYELASNKEITVSQVIEYKRFYLSFNRSLDFVLSNQLHILYISISSIILNDQKDQIFGDGIQQAYKLNHAMIS